MTTSELRSVNPATEELMATFPTATENEIAATLGAARAAFVGWRRTPLAERCGRLRQAAAYLRAHRLRLASLITAEMGKPVREAQAEIEKCARACDHFADAAADYLAPQPRSSNAARSWVQFTPLGPVLAIMPWNFPFWQTIRFAAPALAAGNVAVLKHAANVPQCAAACEEVFRESGFPSGVFANLYVAGRVASELVERPEIAAVTLTGSERAGASVAEAAGRSLKKTVLELGGSDPFLVLRDADLDAAARAGVRSRFQNAGQSCIAAKRFIVEDDVYDEFRERFVAGVAELHVGDPTDAGVDVGPLARDDLRAELERQVADSVARGARVLRGGSSRAGRGYWFEPTIVEDVARPMPLWTEEVFGPVAVLVRARDLDSALQLANDTRYGLGASVWTGDDSVAATSAAELACGQVFLNGIVASDPRLPFGGVKRSGYGRELSDFGAREFVNVQTVWLGPPQDS